MKIWETDLAMKLDENTWQNIIDRIHFPFTSNKIKEANFKFIQKLYLTPIKMHKISRENSLNCPRCKNKQGTYMHMFWHCEKLKDFWNSVYSFTKSVLEIQFNASPCVYLLNDLPDIRMDSKKSSSSSSSAYPGSGRGGSSSSRGPQTSLSRATLTSSDGGIPRRSQASVEI